jgi:DNA-binding transcriptional LysR family regulator
MPRSGVAEYEAAIVLSRLRNFRAAARELNVAPSALSNVIASLETRLGVRLFNRTTRSVGVTEAGEEFLARIVPALAAINAAVEAVNGHRETPVGILQLNTNALAVRQISSLVAEYLRRYPQMKVEIATDSAFVDIVAGGFDAGIRLADDVPKDMVAVPIKHLEQQFVVGAPDYFILHAAPVVPKDLLSHRCILGRLGSGSIWKWEFEKRGKSLQLEVKGPLTLDEPNAMLDAALAGVGVAYLSESLVAEHLAEGRLVRVLDDWTPPYPGISLYYPSRKNLGAGLKAFSDLVRELRRQEAGAAGLSAEMS